jgi:hypothetical protein
MSCALRFSLWRAVYRIFVQHWCVLSNARSRSQPPLSLWWNSFQPAEFRSNQPPLVRFVYTSEQRNQFLCATPNALPLDCCYGFSERRNKKDIVNSVPRVFLSFVAISWWMSSFCSDILIYSVSKISNEEELLASNEIFFETPFESFDERY